MDWTTAKQGTSVGRAPNENEIKHKPGPRRQAKQVTDSLEAFSFLITDNMLTTIVEYTNSNIQNFRRKFENVIVNLNKYTYCDITDLTEMKAFIGIFYIRAVLKVNIHNSNQTWQHNSSNDLFAPTMSLKRFHFLTRFIEFDDKASREERWRFDKFACIRDFFETVNEKSASTRSPSPYLAIDETFYPYRGSIGIKQYNPSKPAKYGLSITAYVMLLCLIRTIHCHMPKKIRNKQ